MTRRIFVGGVWLATLLGALILVFFPRFSGVDLAGNDLVFIAVVAVDAMAFASVGAVLSIRLPENRVGLVLRTGAIMLVLTFMGYNLGAALTISRGQDDVLAGLLALLGGVGIFPSLVVAGAVTALVFPDGHLPGPRWRWPVRAIAISLGVGSLLIVVRPGSAGNGLATNPLGITGIPWLAAMEPFGELFYGIGAVAALALALAGTVVRFRRSRGVEREQLKWFAAASVAVLVLLVASLADGSSETTALDVASSFSLSLPPIAVGVAILRYRLYEIDRLISRTLAYGALTAVLAGTYLVGFLAVEAALAPFIQGGGSIAVAASTLAVFALFQPLRGRLQGSMDRRFDRSRYDAQQTVETFAIRLRDEVDLDRLDEEIAGVVQRTLAPVHARVWLRSSGQARVS